MTQPGRSLTVAKLERDSKAVLEELEATSKPIAVIQRGRSMAVLELVMPEPPGRRGRRRGRRRLMGGVRP